MELLTVCVDVYAPLEKCNTFMCEIYEVYSLLIGTHH